MIERRLNKIKLFPHSLTKQNKQKIYSTIEAEANSPNNQTGARQVIRELWLYEFHKLKSQNLVLSRNKRSIYPLDTEHKNQHGHCNSQSYRSCSYNIHCADNHCSENLHFQDSSRFQVEHQISDEKMSKGHNF